MVQETWVELQDKEKVVWGSYVIRKYLGEEYTEVEWLVGPIPGSDGKEVVMTYTANPKGSPSDDSDQKVEFFTDSNGRQMIHRIKNERFSFNFTEQDVERDPITSNYYPITTGYQTLYNNYTLD